MQKLNYISKFDYSTVIFLLYFCHVIFYEAQFLIRSVRSALLHLSLLLTHQAIDSVSWPCHSSLLNLDFPLMPLCSGHITFVRQCSSKRGPGVWTNRIPTPVMVFIAQTHFLSHSCPKKTKHSSCLFNQIYLEWTTGSVLGGQRGQIVNMHSVITPGLGQKRGFCWGNIRLTLDRYSVSLKSASWENNRGEIYEKPHIWSAG